MNNENYDQQGIQFEAEWDVSDILSLKYIFGRNQSLYQRITDDDSTIRPPDRQFYATMKATTRAMSYRRFTIWATALP